MPKHTLPLIRPMLAVSSPPFDSSEHLFEVKWDGYRGLAYLDNNTTLRSRNLTDLTAKFPELGSMHRSVDRLPAILDGEIVVLQGGKPSFAALQARGRNISTKIRPAAAVFVVFDVLYTKGESVMHMPLIHRKELLHNMVTEDERLILSRYIQKEGRHIMKPVYGKAWKELWPRSCKARINRAGVQKAGKNSGTPWKLIWSYVVFRPAPAAGPWAR